MMSVKFGVLSESDDELSKLKSDSLNNSWSIILLDSWSNSLIKFELQGVPTIEGTLNCD